MSNSDGDVYADFDTKMSNMLRKGWVPIGSIHHHYSPLDDITFIITGVVKPK